MIFGVGCDITKVSRFEKWVLSKDMIKRFYNESECISESAGLQRKCEFYASRFAAKEAFSKALGTGIRGFNLNEVFISKGDNKKPEIKVLGNAKKLLEEKCGEKYKIHVSLSHEKEYALAFVAIEILS
ncbi:holo-ACP synthase [uncultured Treponema sp.]|uniref:holo-ACP synthase n=1 Tax=uncultured Treponema sp. TaxID=162155 RepID=UPI000E8F69A9|nr:holo-ACP synthase [uncultured Treponema sp.]HAZ96799.1 holo-[acyl-carrier-protein] synthase [Treponema sp.]